MDGKFVRLINENVRKYFLCVSQHGKTLLYFLKKCYTYTKDDENSIVNSPVLKTLYSIVRNIFPIVLLLLMQRRGKCNLYSCTPSLYSTGMSWLVNYFHLGW